LWGFAQTRLTFKELRQKIEEVKEELLDKDNLDPQHTFQESSSIGEKDP
jgi:hypothetical protein